MTLNYDEKVEISKLPPTKPYRGCPLLRAAKDKKLTAALLAEFNDTAIAERAMRVIKGMR